MVSTLQLHSPDAEGAFNQNRFCKKTADMLRLYAPAGIHLHCR